MSELPDLGSCVGEQNYFVTDNREKRWCLKEGFPEGFKNPGFKSQLLHTFPTSYDSGGHSPNFTGIKTLPL